MIDNEYLDEGAPLALLNDGGDLEIPVTVAGGCCVDLNSAGPPSAAVLTCLLDSTVTIGGDVPSEIRAALMRIPVPPLFNASSWLCHHRPLVFHAGAAKIGDINMRYLPRFGVIFPDYD
ncbi:hypothetical protein GCM10023195_29870 [Actinoallomurus liliacearum]|uniref:Uncharacterized protein n=1 Tax=Actinoallomurus liliacearum TaxID=1080073 RepID=A0ABP8TIL8_9ACTN